MMAAWDKTHIAHFGRHVLKKNTQGQWAVVCMGPELNILVPFHLLPASWRFEIQFAMVEFDVGPNQILNHINKNRLTRKFPKRRMQVSR